MYCKLKKIFKKYYYNIYIIMSNKYRYEYIRIDADNNLRSKSRVIKNQEYSNDPTELPLWNFDGSSTGQAPGIDSEVYLKPIKIYNDPFSKRNKEDNVLDFLVLCETINDDMETPHNTNTRSQLRLLMLDENIIDNDPWFGFEMEFLII